MSLFQLGLRPFYALASLFAIFSLLALFSSVIGSATGSSTSFTMSWHSHEMLFGFSIAVVSGFLLTAVRNWTGLPTPQGTLLAMMAALWLAGRVLMLTGADVVAAVVDASFLPVLALAIAVPIVRSRNTRNYKVLAIVIALATTHAVYHFADLHYLPGWLQRASLFTSIDFLLILMAIVGGRIIPAFTNNAIKGAGARNEMGVEVVTFVSMSLVLLASTHSSFGTISPTLMAWLCIIAAAAHATRLSLWNPVATLNNPLLWMLPVAYSWIPFAFLLRGLAEIHIVAPGAWVHAVMTGAVSGMMLAMMMRSSLGHTGRKLLASRVDVSAFLLLQAAALARVVGSVLAGENYPFWVIAAGLLWIAAFLLFAVRYVPMLIQARAAD